MTFGKVQHRSSVKRGQYRESGLIEGARDVLQNVLVTIGNKDNGMIGIWHI